MTRTTSGPADSSFTISFQERGSPSTRKKQKRVVNSLNDLAWKSVSRPGKLGFEGDDGILELEEVEDVEVVYEETENGKVVKFKVRKSSPCESKC